MAQIENDPLGKIIDLHNINNFTFSNIVTLLKYNNVNKNAGDFNDNFVKNMKLNNLFDMLIAADFLEIDLDGSLIGLGAWLNTNSVSFDKDIELKALQSAKNYRDKFPHTNPYPELNQAISKTFSLVDVETNK